MKKLIFLFTLLIYGSMAYAQVAAGPDQEQINRQVWYPFVAAYNSLDDEAFMKLHEADVIRVVRDRKEMMVGADYAKAMKMNADWNKENAVTRQIEFSFLERVAKDDTAFEVGYYKVTNVRGGEKRSFYGIFTVVMKKKNGIWKILLDSDTSNQGTVKEADFQKGVPLKKVN